MTTPAIPDPNADRPERTRDQPVSALRGASAEVDPRRVARLGVGLVLATLLILTIVFALVGAHKNQQADALRTHGVPVTYTVSKCVGQLGGSGSNVAGYSCLGSYRIDGRHYAEALPGKTFYQPGARVAAVAVPSDPTLLSVPSIVRNEQASWKVFILPGVFLLLFLLVVAAVALQGRRRQSQAGGV